MTMQAYDALGTGLRLWRQFAAAAIELNFGQAATRLTLLKAGHWQDWPGTFKALAQ